MASRRLLKQWAILVLLLACMRQTGSSTIAASLFTGIDDLQPLPVQGNTQAIRVVSDLPFQYQLIPLNADQVLVRFLNARLSARMQTSNGVLPIETGGSVVAHATLRISDTPDVEEIVLIGEGLGKKKIILEGGEEQTISQRELSRYALPNKNIPVSQPRQQYVPSAFPPVADNRGPYAVAQSGNGFQLPLYNTKRKQGNTAEETQEQLPQSQPVRLPRPSFQPEVDNQDIGNSNSQGWQETYEPPPMTVTSEPTLETNPTSPTAMDSTETEIELQQSLQTRSPAVASNTNHEGALLRPKSEIEAKPRLELSLEDTKTIGSRKIAKSATAVKQPNKTTGFEQKAAVPSETVKPLNKPVVHFPDATPYSAEATNSATAHASPQEDWQEERVAGSSPSISSPDSSAIPAPAQVSYQTAYQSAYSAQPNYNEPAYNTLAYCSPLQLQGALEKAKEQYSEHRYEAAESTIETALQANPKDPSLYAALGELYIEQHRYPNAQMAYGQAYALAQNTHAVRYAQVLILTHQSQQAIPVLQKFLSQKTMQPTPADTGKAHYMLGTLLEERGDSQKALPHLQQAAQFLPSDADIQYNLALAYELTGNLPMAKAHYSKATQLNPSAVDAQQGLNRLKKAGD